MAYATVDDLDDALGDDPTPRNPDQLLELASTEIDALLVGCVYTVNASGQPVEAADIAKLRDLTVLQALWMADDPHGHKDHIQSMRTSQVSVQRAGSRPRFAPRAVAYLQARGWPGSGLQVSRV